MLLSRGGISWGASAAQGVLGSNDWLETAAARASDAANRQSLIVLGNDLIVVVHIDNGRDALNIVLIFLVVNNFVAIEGVVDVLVLILVGLQCLDASISGVTYEALSALVAVKHAPFSCLL